MRGSIIGRGRGRLLGHKIRFRTSCGRRDRRETVGACRALYSLAAVKIDEVIGSSISGGWKSVGGRGERVKSCVLGTKSLVPRRGNRAGLGKGGTPSVSLKGIREKRKQARGACFSFGTAE